MKPIIRFAEIRDLPSIVDIYNQAIRSKSATGDMVEFSKEEKKDWFDQFDRDHYPIYVAELNEVIGFLTFSPYRNGKKAMRKIAEVSFFLDYSWHKKGVGSLLLSHAISECKRLGKETLLAILLDINSSSITLLKKFNFKEWGYFPDVVDFDEHKCGQLIYGLKL